MSTVVSEPAPLAIPTGMGIHPRRRIVVISIAFLQILRRDVLITARELIPFLIQVLLQPFFFLFLFGKLLPDIGIMPPQFPAIFFPGILAGNIVMAALQSATISLTVDLNHSREIEDRLLAPLPVTLVALEKVLFSALRSLLAGAMSFPLAYLVLGNGYQVRTDLLLPLVGIMFLAGLASAALGLTLGSVFKAAQLSVISALLFNVLLFAGCVFYPWQSLSRVRVFQLITLLNPITYTSEGLRYALVPVAHGHTYPTLGIGWVVLGLSVTLVIFLALGLRAFHKRVIA